MTQTSKQKQKDMPATFLGALPAIATGVSQLASTFFGNKSRETENRRSQDFSREMYERQYSDNVSFWNKQNTYNSPQEQVKRIQAAGLNKALLYGQSAGGVSGQAGSINTPSVTSAQFDPKEYDRINMGEVMEVGIKKAQTSNLRKTNEVLQEEKLKKQAETAGIKQINKENKYNFDTHVHKTESTNVPNQHFRFASVWRDIEKHNTSINLSKAQMDKLMKDTKVQEIIIKAHEQLGPTAKFIMNLIKGLR